MMTLKELKGLGRLLTSFVAMFADCFSSVAGRRLLRIYVQGQLSDIIPCGRCRVIQGLRSAIACTTCFARHHQACLGTTMILH